MVKRICLTVLFFLSSASCLFAADEPKVTGFAAAGGFNKYVFRGYEFSSRSVVSGATSTPMNIPRSLSSRIGRGKRASTNRI
jgi:hypothetical protein